MFALPLNGFCQLLSLASFSLLSACLFFFPSLSLSAVQPSNNNFLVYFQDDLPGQALLDVVFARLNLIETSYFGIRYIDDENQTVSGRKEEWRRGLRGPAGYGSCLGTSCCPFGQTYWFLKFIFVFIEIQ